jgi:hypothetical protein
LNEIQLEALGVSVELDGYSRPSVVEEQIKKLHLKLEGASRPPYALYK